MTDIQLVYVYDPDMQFIGCFAIPKKLCDAYTAHAKAHGGNPPPVPAIDYLGLSQMRPFNMVESSKIHIRWRYE